MGVGRVKIPTLTTSLPTPLSIQIQRYGASMKEQQRICKHCDEEHKTTTGNSTHLTPWTLLLDGVFMKHEQGAIGFTRFLWRQGIDHVAEDVLQHTHTPRSILM